MSSSSRVKLCTDAAGRWVARLFDSIATPERPLVLVIDDIQWMPADELDLWRHVLAKSQLANLLLLTTSRTESDKEPRNWLWEHTEQIWVPPLDEEGVRRVINVCLHDAVDDDEVLASYIFAETKGSSLYGQTLLATLVKEKVLHFDFGSLRWQFDPTELYRHLSTSGLDAYLERLILELPSKVRDVLEVSAIN